MNELRECYWILLGSGPTLRLRAKPRKHPDPNLKASEDVMKKPQGVATPAAELSGGFWVEELFAGEVQEG